MRKLLVVILINAMIIVGCGTQNNNRVTEDITEGIPVSSREVKISPVSEKILTLGEIQAATSISVMTGGRGDVREVYVKPGDMVSKGAVLLKLDSDALRSSFNAQESQLRTQRDNLEIQYNDLARTFRQKEILFNEGGISKTEYDNLSSELERTKKKYDDSVANYNNQVKILSEDIADRSITSPISGKVAAVYVEKNESVENEIAVEIIDDNAMIAQTMVTADQVEQLKINDKTYIYPDGDYSYPIEGRITVLNEIAEESTGLYEVEIAIGDTDFALRSGEYAEIEFIVDEREVPIIPKKAVKRVGQDNFVFVIRDKIVSERKVVVGITQGENIEVISGLSSGEVIVDRGRAFVKDGDVVNVIE